MFHLIINGFTLYDFLFENDSNKLVRSFRINLPGRGGTHSSAIPLPTVGKSFRWTPKFAGGMVCEPFRTRLSCKNLALRHVTICKCKQKGASWELNPGPLAYLRFEINPKRDSYH